MAGKKSKRKQVHVKTPFLSQKPPPSHPPASDSEVGLCISSPTDAACDPSVDASVKMCRHLEKGIDVDKLSSQVSKSKFSITHCHDCAIESKSGVGKKGKGRSNRKKESAATADSAAHLQKKWVCLACGHVACGAFPTHLGKKPKEQGNLPNEKDIVAPTGHVCKHSFCSRHPLAFQTTDDLVWCFLCNMAVDCEASLGFVDENSQLSSSRGPLQEALKVVHEKLVRETGFLKDPGKEVSTVDLVRYNVNDTTQSDGLDSTPTMSMHIIRSRRKRTVKGLMNLGNTCFFNSVMQNLLALDMLRDYFNQELPGMEGPLTSSLRKLYLETNLDGAGQLCMGTSETSGFESGLKKGGKGRAAWESVGGACNPRSLFGAICAKAPRFRGFQQQDSHELLRCLLDGLTSEERSAKVRSSCSGDIKKGTTAPVTNHLLMQNGKSISVEPLEGEKESRSSEVTTSPSVTATTFVETFFGGQLCSTVRCCECGHSSIVFEPMLDLSLQIPNHPKKGQVCANQSKLSSSGGGSQQRTGKHTKVLPKTSLHRLSHTGDSAVVDISKTSLQGGQSAQAGLTSVSSPAGTSKHATIDNSSDFGWLDFISGGIQSAESSVQGTCDTLNTTEVSESNLAVPVIEPNAANTDSAASTSSTVNAEADLSKDAFQSALASAEEQDNKPHIERLEAGTSLNCNEEEVEKPLALSEGEDGPLPLASGILLLPYEPLEMSSTSRGEQSVAFMESAPNCSSVDMSSPLTELEGGFLDGFSQLFEEEESCFTASEKMKSSGSNLEDSQVIEESVWDDGSWDAETSVYGRSEVAAALQRLASSEDAFLSMSLEGCLADFTKPELLCGENAWECESCTRRIKGKASSVRSGGNIDNPVSIKDMNGGEKHENPASILPRKDSIGGHSFSCTENGVPGKVLQEEWEGTSGGDNGNAKVSSSVHLVVHQTVNENENSKSDDGQHPVRQPVSIVMETLSSADSVAGTPNLEMNSESNMQCSGDNTSAFKSFLKEAAQKGCSDVKCMGLVNSENLTTSQNKFAKETKSKIKARQPPEKLVKRNATKKLSISKAPPILTVHLKRFAQDMRGRLSKLSGHVAFPEILDLRPFLDPRCLDSTHCFYQLVGVVEHGGTMRGGHYIAYVRSRSLEEAVDGAEQESKDAWYCVSDSCVHKASLQAVLNSEAYLLFYEKCNVNGEDGRT